MPYSTRRTGGGQGCFSAAELDRRTGQSHRWLGARGHAAALVTASAGVPTIGHRCEPAPYSLPCSCWPRARRWPAQPRGHRTARVWCGAMRPRRLQPSTSAHLDLPRLDRVSVAQGHRGRGGPGLTQDRPPNLEAWKVWRRDNDWPRRARSAEARGVLAVRRRPGARCAGPRRSGDGRRARAVDDRRFLEIANSWIAVSVASLRNSARHVTPRARRDLGVQADSMSWTDRRRSRGALSSTRRRLDTWMH